jgi:hypothetical protein
MLESLRGAGHFVYDFRDEDGFHWSEIDPHYKKWRVDEYNIALTTDAAKRGFLRDYAAMQASRACVLLLPCGRSAHLEAGWFIGQDKPTAIFIPSGEFQEPELMYKFCPIFWFTDELLEWTEENDK